MNFNQQFVIIASSKKREFTRWVKEGGYEHIARRDFGLGVHIKERNDHLKIWAPNVRGKTNPSAVGNKRRSVHSIEVKVVKREVEKWFRKW